MGESRHIIQKTEMGEREKKSNSIREKREERDNKKQGERGKDKLNN